MRDRHPTCQPAMPRYARTSAEQGIAILTVLLLVVAITVVAGAMLAHQQLSIRQYGLVVDQSRMQSAAQSAQAVALAMLVADAKSSTFDSTKEAWAQPILPMRLEGMDVEMRIADASARFNVNNLYHDGAVDKAALAAFKRLLESLDLDPLLAGAVLDWQDPDDEPYPEGGAETAAYTMLAGIGNASAKNGEGTASRPANQPFISVEQLAQVKGFDPQSVAKLAPYVVAVPYFLPVNVNTADALVIAAILSNDNVVMDLPSAQQLVTSLKADPAQSLTALEAHPNIAPFLSKEHPLPKAMLSVNSQAFAVTVTLTKTGQATASNNSMTETNRSDSAQVRYMTFMVAKPAMTNPTSPSTTTNATPMNATDSAQTMTDEQAKDIKAFATRYWIYPPR